MGYDGFISVNKHMDVTELPADFAAAIGATQAVHGIVYVSWPIFHERSYGFSDLMISLGYDVDGTEQPFSDDDAGKVADWIDTNYGPGTQEEAILLAATGEDALTYRGSV